MRGGETPLGQPPKTAALLQISLRNAGVPAGVPRLRFTSGGEDAAYPAAEDGGVPPASQRMR